MNTQKTVEPRKNRFQITRLEERIAPTRQSGLVNVNVERSLNNVNVGVAAQALTADSNQIFHQV